jgi:Glycosyl transferase family 2
MSNLTAQKEMQKCFVSVLIDTYNHERFIEQAVSSVLAQDFPARDREILVIDDGSTDRTAEILKKFGSQIRVLRKSNGGQGSAFNVGIPECKGELIAFLDGDDWWLPGKLGRVVEIMQTRPSIGAVGHGFVEAAESGWRHTVCTSSEVRLRLDSKTSAETFRQHRCYLGTSRLTLRADLARRILPVPEELVFEADEYLFTLAPVLAEAVILPEVLTTYRWHGANLFLASSGTREGERRKASVLTALAKELRTALSKWDVPPEARGPVLEMVELEAAQLRLSFDWGTPWETFRTETSLYRILHADASWRSKAFRAFSMIPALLLPSRWFYAGRRWLATQSWYVHARKSAIPTPAILPEHGMNSRTPMKGTQ